MLYTCHILQSRGIVQEEIARGCINLVLRSFTGGCETNLTMFFSSDVHARESTRTKNIT